MRESAGVAISIAQGLPLRSQIRTVCVLDVERGVPVPRREFGKVAAHGQFADTPCEKHPHMPVERGKQYRARASISAQLTILTKDRDEIDAFCRLECGKRFPTTLAVGIAQVR